MPACKTDVKQYMMMMMILFCLKATSSKQRAAFDWMMMCRGHSNFTEKQKNKRSKDVY